MKHEVHPDGSETLYWKCPGCLFGHSANVKLGSLTPAGTPLWGWNGNTECCTITPSYLCWRDADTDDDGNARPARRCHVFITDGQIQFLGDCTHALAGQTVPVP